MLPHLPGPLELVLILLIVAMLFGVGKLPEVFGAVGKGIREFRRESSASEDKSKDEQPAPVAAQPAASTVNGAAPAPANAEAAVPASTENA
jgi:sec-independent protein translocase protein TatA